MRRITISLTIELGKDPEPEEWREGYSTVERSPRTDRDEEGARERRPIGFAKEASA